MNSLEYDLSKKEKKDVFDYGYSETNKFFAKENLTNV